MVITIFISTFNLTTEKKENPLIVFIFNGVFIDILPAIILTFVLHLKKIYFSLS